MENQSNQNARPTFLTVICIISFCFLGLNIINSFNSLLFSSFFSSFYNHIQDGFEMALNEAEATNPASVIFLESMFTAILKLFDVLPLLAGLGIVLSLLALAGVILMWKLNKNGFYLYSAAKAILVFLPIILIGYNFLSVIITISYFIGAALFITMYGLNLKAMK